MGGDARASSIADVAIAAHFTKRARVHVANAFNLYNNNAGSLTAAHKQIALATYSINEARELMVAIDDSSDSEWTSVYFTPSTPEAAARLVDESTRRIEDDAFTDELTKNLVD